jgi:hypothetical protein
MTTIKVGHVSMDDKGGKEFADLIGASAEGIPNVKLFSYKEFAAIPLMDGNTIRGVKKLRKMVRSWLESACFSQLSVMSAIR